MLRVGGNFCKKTRIENQSIVPDHRKDLQEIKNLTKGFSLQLQVALSLITSKKDLGNIPVDLKDFVLQLSINPQKNIINDNDKMYWKTIEEKMDEIASHYFRFSEFESMYEVSTQRNERNCSKQSVTFMRSLPVYLISMYIDKLDINLCLDTLFEAMTEKDEFLANKIFENFLEKRKDENIKFSMGKVIQLFDLAKKMKQDNLVKKIDNFLAQIGKENFNISK